MEVRPTAGPPALFMVFGGVLVPGRRRSDDPSQQSTEPGDVQPSLVGPDPSASGTPWILAGMSDDNPWLSAEAQPGGAATAPPAPIARDPSPAVPDAGTDSALPSWPTTTRELPPGWPTAPGRGVPAGELPPDWAAAPGGSSRSKRGGSLAAGERSAEDPWSRDGGSLAEDLAATAAPATDRDTGGGSRRGRRSGEKGGARRKLQDAPEHGSSSTPERQGGSGPWADPAESSSEQRGDGSEGRSGRRGGSRRGGQPAAPLDPREAAREICLRQLAVRPRTRLELATAMRKRGVEDEIADEILDRYDEVGIIDDAAFARAWVASRHHGKGLARRALAGELRRKGVAPDEVGEALDELDPDVEEQTARALVARRLRVESNAPPEAVFRRLVGMLARKGYPPGMAIRLVKEGLAARDDAAEFADGIDADALADAALDPDQR